MDISIIDLTCCNNPKPIWRVAGSVFTTYGEYNDNIVEYLECEHCGTIFEDRKEDEHA